MYDDIRLHVAWSYTSSADSPFSSNDIILYSVEPPYNIRSSSLPSPLFFHLNRPPSYVVLSLLITCPCHFNPDTPQFCGGNPYFFSENLYLSIRILNLCIDVVCQKIATLCKKINCQQQITKIGALRHVARQSD